jgi:peroxiredoxin
MRIGIFTILFIAAGCASNGLAPVGNVQQPAPDFSLSTLSGDQMALSTLKGKVIVLDFWATWCEPCVQGLPHLQSMAANTDFAQRGLTVLAVNEEEKPDVIRSFIDNKHFTFTVVRDADGAVGRAYSAFSLPTTIVVGRDGLVQAVISGWTPDTAHQIDDAVNHALEAPIR